MLAYKEAYINIIKTKKEMWVVNNWLENILAIIGKHWNRRRESSMSMQLGEE